MEVKATRLNDRSHMGLQTHKRLVTTDEDVISVKRDLQTMRPSQSLQPLGDTRETEEQVGKRRACWGPLWNSMIVGR
jgi:hypothetical protein